MIADDHSLVDVDRVDEWLGDRLGGPRPLSIKRVTTGHSNELFAVTRGGATWMLRRPPRVSNAPGAHDMAREYRVLLALEGTDVPHAIPRGFCDDSTIIGAPFYVMDRVDGVALHEEFPDALRGERRAIGEALVDALATLHWLDWRAAGLEGFGRPDGFTERQSTRWAKQLGSYIARDVPELRDVAAWLADNCPGTGGAALIHGDFGLHNVLAAPAPPARLLAIVDWETATIGDPLADLGYLLKDWFEPGEEEWAALGPPDGMDGYPTRAEMVARYASGTGRDVTIADLVWYRVLGQFKIAVILEGSYGRYVRGESEDPFFATLERRVPLLARHALAIARHQA